MMRSKKPHDSMFPKNTWDTRECKLEYAPKSGEKKKQHVNMPMERVGGTLGMPLTLPTQRNTCKWEIRVN